VIKNWWKWNWMGRASSKKRWQARRGTTEEKTEWSIIEVGTGNCLIFGLKKNNLFICGLFNDAVSSSDYIASTARIINGPWIDKGTEGSGRGLFVGIIWHLPEAGVITSRPQCSVKKKKQLLAAIVVTALQIGCVGRHRRWEDNIKTYLRNIHYE
jgi:hypothetical protein